MSPIVIPAEKQLQSTLFYLLLALHRLVRVKVTQLDDERLHSAFLALGDQLRHDNGVVRSLAHYNRLK